MPLSKAGDTVTADCIVIKTNEIKVSKFSLIGETYPVRKQTGKLAEDTEVKRLYLKTNF